MTEPLVLLPGMACDVRLFEHQIQQLSQDRAVMFCPITQAERIEDIVREILPQLPARFALAGLSMGGIVAMELMRRAPERITRLCLMSTDATTDTPQIAAAREPLMISARVGKLDQALAQMTRPETLAPGPGRMALLDLVRDMGVGLGPDVFVRQMKALQRRPDQQGTLRKIKVPTLILCGAHDRMTSVRRHTFLAELISGAELKVIEDAGHLPTLETPETVTEYLRGWLVG
ncbi:alpha/beta fold hydrolase [Ruegeria aquimaris]|uniref:Alpha/beta hydrolase n=1 Tax=Ruegeria aquimaris TaxID=2984333 RepID=A0ABT3AER0_9RHOB|nr:alpha/beta hydrolase [Ruegeria sp. XHP0148]MCV2887168.1 alpha/beta hydrolase [Ruegeria sp. XHP0148]